jgi:hypothetical protein
MARENDPDSDETEQRLRKILKGVFSGPPTPLTDIPKRNGESRSFKREGHQRPRRRLRRQRKNRAA